MPHVNDCKLAYFESQLSKTGQLNDLMHEWLLANAPGALTPDFEVIGNQVTLGTGALVNGNTDVGKTQINAGVVEVVPAGAVRVNDGLLVYEPEEINHNIWSYDLTQWSFFGDPGQNPVLNEVGITGSANTACTFPESASSESLDVTIPVTDGLTHGAKYWFKKRTGNAGEHEFYAGTYLVGGTTELFSNIIFDLVTGTVRYYSTSPVVGRNRVDEVGDWWVLTVEITNNATGNSLIYCNIDTYAQVPPLDYALNGTVIVGQVEIHVGNSTLSNAGKSLEEVASLNPIITNGTAVTTNFDNITCPIGTNFNTAAGWMLIRLNQLTRYNAISAGTVPLFLCNISVISLLSTQVAGQDAKTADGTGVISNPNLNLGVDTTDVYVAVIWNQAELNFAVGHNAQGVWNWASPVTGDGNIEIGTDFSWFNTPAGTGPYYAPIKTPLLQIGKSLPAPTIDESKVVIEQAVAGGGQANAQLNDLWYAYLTANGIAAGQLNDMMVAWMKAQGAIGETLNDLQYDYYCRLVAPP